MEQGAAKSEPPSQTSLPSSSTSPGPPPAPDEGPPHPQSPLLQVDPSTASPSPNPATSSASPTVTSTAPLPNKEDTNHMNDEDEGSQGSQGNQRRSRNLHPDSEHLRIEDESPKRRSGIAFEDSSVEMGHVVVDRDEDGDNEEEDDEVESAERRQRHHRRRRMDPAVDYENRRDSLVLYQYPGDVSATSAQPTASTTRTISNHPSDSESSEDAGRSNRMRYGEPGLHSDSNSDDGSISYPKSRTSLRRESSKRSSSSSTKRVRFKSPDTTVTRYREERRRSERYEAETVQNQHQRSHYSRSDYHAPGGDRGSINFGDGEVAQDLYDAEAYRGQVKHNNEQKVNGEDSTKKAQGRKRRLTMDDLQHDLQPGARLPLFLDAPENDTRRWLKTGLLSLAMLSAGMANAYLGVYLPELQLTIADIHPAPLHPPSGNSSHSLDELFTKDSFVETTHDTGGSGILPLYWPYFGPWQAAEGRALRDLSLLFVSQAVGSCIGALVAHRKLVVRNRGPIFLAAAVGFLALFTGFVTWANSLWELCMLLVGAGLALGFIEATSRQLMGRLWKEGDTEGVRGQGSEFRARQRKEALKNRRVMRSRMGFGFLAYAIGGLLMVLAMLGAVILDDGSAKWAIRTGTLIMGVFAFLLLFLQIYSARDDMLEVEEFLNGSEEAAKKRPKSEDDPLQGREQEGEGERHSAWHKALSLLRTNDYRFLIARTKRHLALYAVNYLLFLVSLFLSFGVQGMLVGWLTSYCQLHLDLRRRLAVAVTAGYWIGFSCGRLADFLLAPLMVRPHILLLASSLIGMCAAALTLITSAIYNHHTTAIVTLMTIMIGFASAFLYPNTYILNYFELEASGEPLSGLYSILWKMSSNLGNALFPLAIGLSFTKPDIGGWDVLFWLATIGLAFFVALNLCTFTVGGIDECMRKQLRTDRRRRSGLRFHPDEVAALISNAPSSSV